MAAFFFFSALYSAIDDLRPRFVIKWPGARGMTVHHDHPEPDPEMTEKPKDFCTAGDGRKEKTRKGEDMGREAREFSTTRHIHCDFFCWWGTSFIRRESPHQNNAMRAGPRTHGQNVSTDYSPGPSPTTCLSATYARTPLSATRDGAAKTDVEKWGLQLGWQFRLQGQCGNEDPTSWLNPCISRRLRELPFVVLPL